MWSSILFVGSVGMNYHLVQAILVIALVLLIATPILLITLWTLFFLGVQLP